MPIRRSACRLVPRRASGAGEDRRDRGRPRGHLPVHPRGTCEEAPGASLEHRSARARRGAASTDRRRGAAAPPRPVDAACGHEQAQAAEPAPPHWSDSPSHGAQRVVRADASVVGDGRPGTPCSRRRRAEQRVPALRRGDAGGRWLLPQTTAATASALQCRGGTRMPARRRSRRPPRRGSRKLLSGA
jgi:hypothetical protein